MYIWRWIAIGVMSCAIGKVWTEEEKPLSVGIGRCCPPGQAFNADYSCVPNDANTPFAPPVYVNGTETPIEVVGSENMNLTCGSDEILQRVILDRQAQLVFFVDEVYLHLFDAVEEALQPEASYCIAESTESDLPDGSTLYVAEFCYADPSVQREKDRIACLNATCIRKCCPEGDIFNGTCHPPDYGTPWSPVFYSSSDPTMIVVEPRDLIILHGVPHCEVSLIYDEQVLLNSGELELPQFPYRIPLEEYCLDAFVSEGELKERSVICHFKEYQSCGYRHFIVDKLFMSISCVFLALTWLIYVCVTELRTSTQGRCMISFISALFVAFVTILVNRNHRDGFSPFQCSFTAVLSHMSILATFFWLNVLCYHIWNCLRSGRKREEKLLFLGYSFYGWGCPLVIALVGVTLDAVKANVIRPDFLPPHCWFNDRTTKWVYQYGFMLALLLVNLAFFLSSAFMVAKRLRQTQDMRIHSDGLWLYLRLFIIMGITWLMEMITWLLEENPCTTWVAVLDGITALHGVYIFLVAVCFSKNFMIFRRCCGRKKYDVDGNTAACTQDNFVELLDGQEK